MASENIITSIKLHTRYQIQQQRNFFVHKTASIQILLVIFLTTTDAYLDESLPVQSIKPSLNSVREHELSSARENTIRDLAVSMHQHGLLYPIIVRPIEDGFEIVAGNRRFEACRLLHWKYIPAMVRELSEKDAFEIQLTENIQRMTMNPIEEAKAFRRYTKQFGW
jgi:ParB family transcriptional regulator, chromosome partitioning protein